LKKTKQNQTVVFLWDQFRDRFWDHLRQVWVGICHSWKGDLGCAGRLSCWHSSAWTKRCLSNYRATCFVGPMALSAINGGTT